MEKEIPTIANARIPIPARVRWRQFRSTFVPAIIFIASLAGLIILWNDYVPDGPGGFEGRIFSPQALIQSPAAGSVTQIWVGINQQVLSGDLLATISKVTPDYLHASLSLLHAELDLVKAEQNNQASDAVLKYQRLKLELMENKASLAAKKVDLDQSARNYQRTLQLQAQQIESIQQIEISKANMDSLKAEVDSLEEMITSLEMSLNEVSGTENSASSENSPSSFEASLNVSESKLKLLEADLKPVEIRSPINGIVTQILTSPGSNVLLGDSILLVEAREPESIVGYLPEPLDRTPKLGDVIYVRAKNLRRLPAQIISVGAQIQEIPIMLRPAYATQLPLYGLPVSLTLPEQLKTEIPGQRVQLSW